MNSIAPLWDGNETWLVLGGGGLLAAFPLAYGVILSALYAPIIAMLLALIFRGVAFEFRWRDPVHQAFWDRAFTGGSFVAAMSQGIVLGALLEGIKVSSRAYAGGWRDWLTPFSLLTGVSVTLAYGLLGLWAYGLLGATWLNLTVEGELQKQAARMAWWLGAATLVAIALVSLATPFLAGDYFDRWLSFPNILWVAAHFGGDPAGKHRHQARRPHRQCKVVQQPGVVKPPPGAGIQTEHAKRGYQHAQSHHDAERPKHDAHRRAVFRRHGVEPRQRRIQVMLEQQRRGFWNLDGVVDAVFGTVRNAKQNQGRAIGMALVVAFHGHHLGRLVLQRVQAVQVAQHDLHRRDEGRHRHGHREHDARAGWSVP